MICNYFARSNICAGQAWTVSGRAAPASACLLGGPVWEGDPHGILFEPSTFWIFAINTSGL